MHYFHGLQVHSHGHAPNCQAWIDRTFPHHHALNFAATGRLLFGIDGEEPRWLTAPVAWWTGPGPRFTYGAAPGEQWDQYYVCFSGPRSEQMHQAGLLPSESRWSQIADAVRLRHDFEALLGSLQERPVDNPHAVWLLEGMLLQIHLQERPVQASSPLEAGVRELASRLREDPAHRVEAATEAARLGVSVVHLRRVFKQLTGLPPQQYRIRQGLDHAAELLRTTSLPIKQIASRVGYEDVYHFSKLFKDRFLIPPGAYRQEMQPANAVRA